MWAFQKTFNTILVRVDTIKIRSFAWSESRSLSPKYFPRGNTSDLHHQKGHEQSMTRRQTEAAGCDEHERLHEQGKFPKFGRRPLTQPAHPRTPHDLATLLPPRSCLLLLSSLIHTYCADQPPISSSSLTDNFDSLSAVSFSSACTC